MQKNTKATSIIGFIGLADRYSASVEVGIKLILLYMHFATEIQILI
jgi:hypothetical protein